MKKRIKARIDQLEAEREQVSQEILGKHPQIVAYTCAIGELTALLPQKEPEAAPPKDKREG